MVTNQSQKLKPAIVLGIHVMGLAIARALGAHGVPVVAVSYDEKEDFGNVSKFVSRTIPAPHPEKFESQFVDLLVRLASEYGGGILIPTTDETLAALSRNKASLERNYVVACTEWNITEKFVDKKYTYALADQVGVPAPKTVVPRTVEDVEKYSHTIEYPVLVKPSQGHKYFEHFKRKMVQVNNLDEMLTAYREAAEIGLETMLQEWIPGEDARGVNYNSYFWDGVPLTEFTAEKVRNAPPQFGSPRVAISKHIPEILEPGRKILQAMGFYGFSCTEFKRDTRDGIYKLMEVNGRHNRSGSLAVKCGINFPWIQYRHLVLGETPPPMDFQDGIYWIDIFRDVTYTLSSFRKEGYSLGQYLKPYRSPRVFAIWDRKDPKPFLKRGINLFKRVV